MSWGAKGRLEEGQGDRGNRRDGVGAFPGRTPGGPDSGGRVRVDRARRRGRSPVRPARLWRLAPVHSRQRECTLKRARRPKNRASQRAQRRTRIRMLAKPRVLDAARAGHLGDTPAPDGRAGGGAAKRVSACSSHPSGPRSKLPPLSMNRTSAAAYGNTAVATPSLVPGFALSTMRLAPPQTGRTHTAIIPTNKPSKRPPPQPAPAPARTPTDPPSPPQGPRLARLTLASHLCHLHIPGNTWLAPLLPPPLLGPVSPSLFPPHDSYPRRRGLCPPLELRLPHCPPLRVPPLPSPHVIRHRAPPRIPGVDPPPSDVFALPSREQQTGPATHRAWGAGHAGSRVVQAMGGEGGACDVRQAC